MLSSIQTICTFDLETTGLSVTQHAILEIACCPFSNELVDLKEFDSGIMRVYDNREITEGALIANGITRDQIANGVDSQKVADDLVKYLNYIKSGRNKPVMAGHNIKKFDLPFLDDFLRVHGYDLSKYINTDYSIDTMWIARLKWTELTNFKLGTCCEQAGIELIDAHRAVNDTRSNKNLLKEFIRSLRSDHNKSNEEEYKRPVFQF